MQIFLIPSGAERRIVALKKQGVYPSAYVSLLTKQKLRSPAMIELIPCMPRLLSARTLAVVICMLFICTPAQAVDIPVETESDYQRLLDAIRATEYTRQGYLEENANPRMVAAVGGLWAFSDRNPLATPEQLDAFVGAYDAALAQAVPGDEHLMSAGSLLTAVNATRIAPEGMLVGTDTRVSRDALALLGLSLPGLESFEQSQQRMARFDVGSIQRWINRSQTADILTALLAGVSPSGVRVEGLETATADYLESLGYTPMLGMVDPDQPEINAGLSGLPDFTGFIAIRDVAGAHVGLETEVFSRIEDIQLDAEARLNAIGNAEIPDDMGLNSIDLFAAAADPDHPDHADAVAQLEARRQAVVDSIRETTDDRAAVFARTMLLQQSSYPDVQYVAENTRSFAGLQLQVNNDLAVAQQSLGIVGSLAGLGAAYATGNVYAGVTSTASLISGVLGLVDLLGDGPPSADQQIFDQIAGLRQQVEDLRVQMNARFDIVDAKLDTIFETMVLAFDRLQDGIDTLISDIASVRSSLDRIEAALYGFAQNLLLVDLTAQTDAILDYRTKTGFDLSYADQSPSFVGGASGFTTFATFTAQTSSFAGPENNQSMILTLDNAADVLSGPDDVVSRLLNDFRRVPPGLVTSDGTPVSGPIITGRAAAPAPWTQAAAAYAQLARENPWYFAYRYGRQVDDYNADPDNESLPELDRIELSGLQIINFIEKIRELDNDDNAVLFDALVQNYKDAAAGLQAQINAEIMAWMPPEFIGTNGVVFDFWTDGPQVDIREVVPSLDYFDHIGNTGSNQHLPVPEDDEKGFRMFTDSDVPEQAMLLQMSYLLERYEADNPGDWRARYQIYDEPGNLEMRAYFWIGGPELVATYPTYKGIDFSAELDLPFGGWQQLTLSDEQAAAQILNAVWPGDIPGNFDDFNEVVVSDRDNPPIGTRSEGFDFRITVEDVGNINWFEPSVKPGLFRRRGEVRNALLLELIDESSALSLAARELDRAEALIDAYVTIGMPNELSASEVLRSALRAVPGTSELGLGSIDVITLIDEFEMNDRSNAYADQDQNVKKIEDILNDRIDVVHAEIMRGLDRPASPPDYVGWMLREIEHVRATAFNLAQDDQYVAGPNGTVVTDTFDGVLINDVDQEFSTITVDTDYDLDPSYIAPANGTVMLYADGSFTYAADPGFVGTDSFSYRSMTSIPGVPNTVYSSPATVVIRVDDVACGVADFNFDGVLNFFDVSAFLIAFQDQDTSADLNEDGLFNFLDVSAFLVAFQAGCP